MLLKNLLKHNFGRYSSAYYKRKILSLRQYGFSAAALNGDCWHFLGSRVISSPVLNVDNCFVKFSTAKFSSSSYPTSSKREQYFKRIDEIPEDFCLIYKAAIDQYITFGRRFAIPCNLLLLGAGIAKAYYLWFPSPSVPEIVQESVQLNDNILSFSSDSAFFTFFLSMAFLALSLNSALSKLPLRMYHNPANDQYIAVLSNGFGYPTKLPFHKGEIKKLNPFGFLPWKENQFSIQSKKVILLEHYFRVPEDYNCLLDIESKDSSN